MELSVGKQSRELAAEQLLPLVTQYTAVLVDLGTGDGRFVRQLAQARPDSLAIGVDTCREDLRESARRAPANALYLIADARQLPLELSGLADWITINFPWASLLDGLLAADPGLLAGLARIVRPGALLELRVNGGALAEVGWTLDQAAPRLQTNLRRAGLTLEASQLLDARALRRCPTTWARRLAFGRDPRALYLRGRLSSAARQASSRVADAGLALV